MKRYLVTIEAEQDIDIIKAYLLRQGGVALARHVLGKLQSSFQFLGNTPGAGHSRQDLTNEAVRFWSVFSYLVIYDPAPRPVHILRVLHSRQDIAALLRR